MRMVAETYILINNNDYLTIGIARAPNMSDPPAFLLAASVRDRGSLPSGTQVVRQHYKIKIKVGMVGFGIIKKHQVFTEIQIEQ